MRINYRERHRRIREARIAAWNEAYNVQSDPGLRDAYPDLPRAPIRLLCSRLVKDVNQGGLLRLAEAFRIERVSFSNEADRAVDLSGQRGATLWQPYEFKEVVDSVREAVDQGYHTVALSISDRAVPIQQVDWRFPLAIVAGEEKFGVPPDIEEMCETVAAIPIYGIIQSLNVTTATAIALHEAMNAYSALNPEFEPARNASRRLLGLPPSSFGTDV